MLYELIAVTRPGNLLEVKEIARTAGAVVLNGGGVVRGLTNWGPFMLPKRIRHYQKSYTQGHYFVMRFDSSAPTQQLVRTTLGLDPRLIRFSVINMGKKLDELKDVPGKVSWRDQTPSIF